MPFTNFQRYLNPVFVETGSYVGDGIQAAIWSGFQQIYSIEISDKYCKFCAERFVNYPNVHLVWGDSRTELWKVIRNIQQPITFWLDGHWSGGDTGHGPERYPILTELAHIANHSIKNHTILIDDVRLFESEWRLRKPDIIEALWRINPYYQIDYEDGYVPRDVLVARIA